MGGKIVKLMLRVLLPVRIYDTVIARWETTKKIMTGTKVLKIFWTIVFLPFTLLFSLIFSLMKVILVWVFGVGAFGKLRYAVKMFSDDLTSKTDRKSFRVAVRRQQLFFELVWKGRERKMSYGKKNPDKTFYVIRPYYFSEGNELSPFRSHLLYNYYRNLQYIAYAVNKNWIPVIDWENFTPLPHQEEFPVNGTKNGWEYFWNQPSQYTLDEVYQSKNVILSDQNTIDTPYIPPCKYPKPYQKNAEKCAILCAPYDKFITFNQPTRQYIEERYKQIFPEGARILGVSVRGTIYNSTQHLPGHPDQPTVGKLLQAIHIHMKDWDMTHLFFACELETIVDEVRKEFGESLLVLPRERYTREPQINDNPLYEPSHRYQTNLDYVTEMALLSRCNSLLAAYSGGVRIAVIWNGGSYEHMEIME